MRAQYELIALDMDGTLLDSGQRISPRAGAAAFFAAWRADLI